MKKICIELRNLGKKYPELLKQRLEVVELTDLEFLIMKLRYIDQWDFKLIPEEIKRINNQAKPYSDRHIFRCHKSAIEKTVAKLKLADWLGFFVQ